MSEPPTWLFVGAELAVYTPSRWNNGGGTIRAAKVVKIGKRDIVLEDGERFNVNNYRASDDEIRRQSSGSYGPGWYLTHPLHPNLALIRRTNRQNRLRANLEEAIDAWKRNRTSEERLEDLAFHASLLQEQIRKDANDD